MTEQEQNELAALAAQTGSEGGADGESDGPSTDDGAGDNTRTDNDQSSKDGESTTVPKTGKRSNWVIAHRTSEDMSFIEWTVKGAGTLRLTVNKLHEKIHARAAIHGMVQRVSDAAAIPRDTKTGKSATPQEKFNAMAQLVNHYESGSAEWNRKGGERGPRELTGAALLRAALELWQPEKGATKIQEFVKGLKQSQIAALLGSAELKEQVEKARSEELKRQTTEEVDAEELLSEL